ncbi:MAG: hypothetical protein ABSD98_09545 [Candidatus Korobacteraceae bacterium]|jgi:hypothetical protein
MMRSEQNRNGLGNIDLWITIAVLAVAVLMIVAATQAQAQTFAVLHNFLSPDGSDPMATLTLDRAGNLYGTTKADGLP